MLRILEQEVYLIADINILMLCLGIGSGGSESRRVLSGQYQLLFIVNGLHLQNWCS